MRLFRHRLFLPLAGFVVAIALMIGATMPKLNPLTTTAKSYNLEIAASTIAVYASLRGINAILSMVQEAEVSGGAVFVSGSTQPFKVLEPIDDTVERISIIIFAVAIASGLLGISLQPLATAGMALAGCALFGLSMISLTGNALWPGRAALTRLTKTGLRLGLILFLLLPGAYSAAFWAGERFTSSIWNDANSTLSDVTNSIEGNMKDNGNEKTDIRSPTNDRSNQLTPVDQSSDSSISQGPTDQPASVEQAHPSQNAGLLSTLVTSIRTMFDEDIPVKAVETPTLPEPGFFTSMTNVAKIVSTIGSRANDLLSSSIEIIVVYLLKLVVLPVIVFFVLLALFRSLIREVAATNNKQEPSSQSLLREVEPNL